MPKKTIRGWYSCKYESTFSSILIINEIVYSKNYLYAYSHLYYMQILYMSVFMVKQLKICYTIKEFKHKSMKDFTKIVLCAHDIKIFFKVKTGKT